VAITLGSVVIELLCNTAGFQSGLSKASYEAKRQTKEIHQSFQEMGNKIGGALSGAFGALGQFGAVAGELARSVSESLEGIGKSTSGIATAIGALGGLAAAGLAAAGAYVELGKSGAELVEHFSQVSQKTGIGIRDLQTFAAAGSTVNVSLDDMVTGMRKFGQAITGFGKGAAAQSVLRELGVTSKDSKEALLEVADAFAKMEDGPRKASDAVALFGKAGLNLIPLLDKGRSGIEDWSKAVDKLGPVIGKDAVEANEKYKTSITELSLAWDKVKVQAEQATIPTLSKLTSWVANNFQSIKAGLAGGFGAAAILKDQQALSKAASDGAKKDSADKDESLRKQEAIGEALRKTFEIQKAGGVAAFALEKARQQLSDDVQAGLYKEASAIQSQLPGLEKAAALEAQRAAEAKRLAASYAAITASFADGSFNVKPFLKAKPSDPTAGIEALFGPQPKKNPLDGAPDLGQPEFMKSISEMPDLFKQTFGTGKAALDDFYNQWNKQQQGTEESINKDFDKQLADWKNLLNNQAISQQQFNDVSNKLEKERQDSLKRLRQDTGTSTFRDAWKDMFQQVEASGKDFARSISEDIGSAIESLNQQLAQFVVTGKGLNLKQIGQSLEANLFTSVLKKAESGLAGSLGSMFGLGGKADGSSQTNALWVQMAGSPFGASGLDNLPLGNFGGLGSLLGLSGSTTTGTTAPGSSSGGLLSGISSFFGNIGSLFGGFLADGGDAQPGKAYIVGEKRPELFVPRSAGTVVPNFASGDSKSITVQNHLHISGVNDADSFKRSQHQIFTQMSRGQQVALARG